MSVVTANYDTYRTNANLNETTLTTSNVSPGTFGLLAAHAVDGNIYGQPLYVPGLRVADGRTANVVYVATMHNTVYAFDADADRGSFEELVWKVSLGKSVPASDYQTTDVSPEVGVLSTPVIDLKTSTLYVVANTVEDGTYYYRIHALDLVTGNEKFNGPAVIQATAPGDSPDSIDGILTFEAFGHLQRPGLLLLNGALYIAFGSHGDGGTYHGWMMSYDAADVSHQLNVFTTTPNGLKGAIWQGGRGPAVDREGNIFIVTANGDFDGQTNFSQSFLKLDQSLSVRDWFTPSNWPALDDGDADLGSSGPIVIPGTDFVVSGGKEGRLYVVARDSLGQIQDGDWQVVQDLPAVGFGIFSSALYNHVAGPILYLAALDDSVKGFRMNRRSGQFGSDPITQSTTTNATPYQGMAISANGSHAGSAILWVSSADDTLHAFDALDLTKELWNSDIHYERDHLGSFAKFASPTIAGGKVFVPTFAGHLLVYGLTNRQVVAPVNPQHR